MESLPPFPVGPELQSQGPWQWKNIFLNAVILFIYPAYNS